MLLSYQDVEELYPDVRGVKDVMFHFQHVSLSASDTQNCGLYIPLVDKEPDLQLAISNGAIAALWREDNEIPTYTPNHFPMYFVSDLSLALKNILKKYKQVVTSHSCDQKDMTTFQILNKKLLNDFFISYDNAVIEKILMQLLRGIREENK